MYSVNSISRQIFIGRKGETGTRSIQFDVSAWMQINDGLTVGIVAIRPGETEAYVPAEVTAANGVLTWVPDAVDTAIPGTGVMLIRGTDSDGNVIKSAQTTYVVESAFDDDGYTPTEPEESWLSHAEAVLAGMVESIENTADQAVDDIEAAAAQAVSDMEGAADTAVENAVQEVLDTAVGAVEDWIEENLSQETGYVLDDSLLVSGAAADAKAVGDVLWPIKSTVEYDHSVVVNDRYVLANSNKVIINPVPAGDLILVRTINGENLSGNVTIYTYEENDTYIGNTGMPSGTSSVTISHATKIIGRLKPNTTPSTPLEAIHITPSTIQTRFDAVESTVEFDHDLTVNDRYVLNNNTLKKITPIPAYETLLFETTDGENLTGNVTIYLYKPDGTGNGNRTMSSGTKSLRVASSNSIGQLKLNTTPSSPIGVTHISPKKIETRLETAEKGVSVAVNERYVLNDSEILSISPVPAGDTIIVRTINGNNLSSNVTIYYYKSDGTGISNVTISSGSNSAEIKSAQIVGQLKLSAVPSTPLEAIHVSPTSLQTRLEKLEETAEYDHSVAVNDRYVLTTENVVVDIDPVPAGDTIIVRTINGENLSGNVTIYTYTANGTYIDNHLISSGTNSVSFKYTSSIVGQLKLNATPSTPLEAIHIDTNTLESRVDALEEDIEDNAAAIEAVEEDLLDFKSEVKRQSSGSATAFFYRQLLPSYYFSQPTTPTSFADNEYMQSCLDRVPKGKHFIFFTDRHWPQNAKHSTKMVAWIADRLKNCYILDGGDTLNRENNKYYAAKMMQDVFNTAFDTFGDRFLPIMGNHDLNTANPPQTDEPYINSLKLTYSVLRRIMHQGLTDKAVHYEPAEKLYEYLGNDQTDYQELMDYFAQNYYVDDEANQIRFIVYNTGTGYSGAVQAHFNRVGMGEQTLYIDWFYDALMTTPAGYDVVVAGHEPTYLAYPNANKDNYTIVGDDLVFTDDSPLSVNARPFIQMMQAYKRGTQTGIYIHGAEPTIWTPNGTLYYDFTTRKAPRHVFHIGGHWHLNGIVVCEGLDGEIQGTSHYAKQLTISQSTGAIPVIYTQTDSCGVSAAYFSDHQDVEGIVFGDMTADTITEQAIDVYTITDDNRVVITRFGAGYDRVYTIV